MTGRQGSVGGENWCVYADLDTYCDTASIMSYGMAWAGSAPGPVSPRSWLEGIYDYAVRAMNPEKLFMGLPGYGWNWQIYDTPENLGKTYRGTSNTYYAAKLWMTGGYNFTDDKPPQPFIPIVAYWDDYDKVPWALPQVYDYMEGRDAVSYEYPLLAGTYNRRHYLTAYGKEQKAAFGTVYLDRGGGTPDSHSGIVSVSDFMTVLGEGSSATRSEEISLDYDFFHSHLLLLSCGQDYTAKIVPRDIIVWISRLFLGEADGFSILYYQDVDSLVYWANEAAYRWKLRGIGHVIDAQIIGSGDALRTAVIFFYISNEGVSPLENSARIGLPIPQKLKDVLAQLHDRDSDKGGKDDGE